MPKCPRRIHSPNLKETATLAAMRGDGAIATLTARFALDTACQEDRALDSPYRAWASCL